MNGKILLLDIDGTLTEPGYNVPPDSALEAVKRAQQNGHRVYLCSGRNLAMLKPLLQYGFDGYVASAGGYVVSGDDVAFDRPMKPEVFRLAMDCFERNHVFRTVACLDGTYGDSGLGDLLEGADAYSNSELLRFRRQLSETLDIRPMSEYNGAPVYKIVFMCTERSQLDEPMELLKDYFVFCVQNLEAVGCLNGEVFVPILPAIVAAGLLMGILNGLKLINEDIATSGVYKILDMFSNAAFTFLPILIAVSAARVFGGNIFLGAVIGMIMVHHHRFRRYPCPSRRHPR